LERLQTTEIAVDEPTVFIQAPKVSPRSGTVVRCDDLSIGYPDHLVAEGIQFELEHGERAAIVGDNGQGKTTLLRTLVHSLNPIGGTMKWGYGVDVGTYAQHVYTSLDERLTVLEHLEYVSDSKTTRQDVLAMAGALLFRDEHIQKKVKVLSGGERARLCMAGLLLGTANVLVLDEPGNHLDVETVEALAEALKQYQGTVIFTSHDRHFMGQVATSVVEVRDGRVRNYFGDYASYLQSVESEIDSGERERNLSAGKKQPSEAPKTGSSTDYRQARRDQRKTEKEIKNLEKKIAKLDEDKRDLKEQMMSENDPVQALKLHEMIEELITQLDECEGRWLELNEEF